MPDNRNPQVAELLSWHGQSGGGVHVPFQARSNPLGEVIETGLVYRLRALATELAGNEGSRPRWIFLVGGPGNGKSETVQDFLVHLDSALGLNGELRQVLTQRFSGSGVLPRRVEITSQDLGASSESFRSKIGRLLVVQDATATENALGNAANELAHDIADLLTHPPTPPLPVFIACANRGLLARAMNEAYHEFHPQNEVTRLLASVIQASSLGRETLSGRKACWPLEVDDRFACWPLDVESLLVDGTAISPLGYVVTRAVEASKWEAVGRCVDCSARESCPFRQNAEWLRQDAQRHNLQTMLRHGELARGQRWNFRDGFSLVAELLVGQWSDFGNASHPCDWVHEQRPGLCASPPDAASALALAMQLYPHALFKANYVRTAARMFRESRDINAQTQPVTLSVVNALSADEDLESTKPIRELLKRDYHRLDPASDTPNSSSHPLRLLEDAFSQSVEQGRGAIQQPSLSPAENAFFEVLEVAEGEWDLLGREWAVGTAAVGFLRKVAAMLGKRSVGVRLGYHALDELLTDYEACLRDSTRLGSVRNALLPLLGDPDFRFNLVEVLGQPTAETNPLICLKGQAPGARAQVAPVATESTPGHDLPCIEVTDTKYRIPLTFDFYLALRLRKDGCAGGSLPASVRAALDRVRHRYAGELCRNEDRFVDGRSTIMLGLARKVGIPAPGGPPALIQD